MTDKLKLGDTVRLKSGGPTMTVAGPPDTDTGALPCQWFVGTKSESAYFPESALELAGPGQFETLAGEPTQ